MKYIVLLFLFSSAQADVKEEYNKNRPPGTAPMTSYEKNGNEVRAGFTLEKDQKPNGGFCGEDLPTAMQSARSIPESGKDGKIIGFKIVDLKPKGFYDRMGLRVKDILIKLNGIDMSDMSKAMEAYGTVKTGSNRWTLIRDGKETEVSFSCP